MKKAIQHNGKLLKFKKDKIMRDYLTGADPNNVISINNEEDIIIIKSKIDNIMADGYHHYCGGTIDIKDNEKYKIILCNYCKLRIKFPSNINTTSELKEYFENKIKVEVKKYNKFENIDI